MTDKKVISYGDLINYMNTKTLNMKTIKTCGEAVDVTTVLSINKFETLIENIVDSVFDGDGNYLPEARDFFTRLYIVFAYTSVDIPTDLEDMSDDLYMLLYSTDFYDQISQAINPAQLEAVLYAVDSKINMRIKQNTSFVGAFKKMFDEYAGIFTEDNIQALTALSNTVASGEISANSIVDAFAGKFFDAQNKLETSENSGD